MIPRHVDKLVAALDEPRTVKYLAEHLRITRKTVRTTLKHLGKKVHVAGWKHSDSGRGPDEAVWALGAAPNAKRKLKPADFKPRQVYAATPAPAPAEIKPTGSLRPRRDPFLAAFFGGPCGCDTSSQ